VPENGIPLWTLSMFDHVLSLIRGDSSPPRSGDDLKVAVAALLVETARMDDTFDAAERALILRLLGARFGLDAAAATPLLAAAERADAGAADLFRFTKAVIDAFTPAERIGLIEMMWEVAFADGTPDPDEDALLRRVAGLIGVDDRDRGEAKHRVMARLGRYAAG
jgi:uncharacterized tellurite resistance protein B-like protein